MSFLEVIDDLAGGKPMRKTKERRKKVHIQQQECNDDDGDETTKPDVKLPKQKPFRVVTTPATVRNQGKSCTTTTTTTTLKDAEVMASMQTSDIALNAMSVYRVLDENVSEKKSTEEPYRTLRGTVMKDERRKRKASFKDVGNDDNPFVVYIDPNVGRTRLNIFSKNVPEKLGGIVVPHVEESIIDTDRLLVGKFERSFTKFQKHKSKKHPKTKKKESKKEDEEIGISHVVTTREGYTKYEKNAPDDCITKFVSPEYIAACLKEKKILPIEEKWSFAAATTSSMKKSTKEVTKMNRTENDRRREQNHDEEVLMEIAQITLEQARIALTYFGSLEFAAEALLEGKVSFQEVNGEQTLAENVSNQSSIESDAEKKHYYSLEKMKKIKKHFMCQPKGDRVVNQDSNASLIDMFSDYGSMLQEMYPDNKQQRGRGNAYAKIAHLLRSTPYELTPNNIDEFIMKNRGGGQGMGESMCNKLKHAVSFKILPEYQAFLKDPLVVAVKDMSRVHGIGTKTALKFYNRFNLKSCTDLRALLESGDPENILNRDMRISLKYLEDLEERIPREEVKEIGDFVRESVEKIVKGTQVEIAGSYRRGKPMCGDVDVLVCLKENQKKEGVLQKILDDIDKRGLITAKLTHGTFGQNTFMGVCKLPNKENCKHRRIDIKIYEPKEFATALLYFTGSGRFNRSMRTYTHMLGWHLDDKGLYMDRNKSRRMKIDTEQDIFAALGLDYVRPHDRSVG